MTKQQWLSDYISWRDAISLAGQNDDILGNLNMILNLDNKIKQRKDLTKIALSKFIANLYAGWLTNRPIRFSKNIKHYKASNRYCRSWKGYRRMMAIYDALLKQGYIQEAKGYRSKRGSAMTKIWATPRLSDFLRAGIMVEIDPPEEVVFLRTEGKFDCDYDDTDETIAMRDRIKQYNKLLDDTDISFSIYHYDYDNTNNIYKELHSINFISNALYSSKKSSVQVSREEGGKRKRRRRIYDDTNNIFKINYKRLFRVFNRGSWEHGGRFYAPVHVALPKLSRRTITINNQPTVELDYSGLHIRMLYHRLNIPFDGECYVYNKHDDKHKDQRNIIKTMSLVAINADSEDKAVYATVDKLLMKKTKDELIYVPTYAEAREAYHNFIEHHTPIKDFIASDAGITLQYQDSVIMDNILTRMMLEHHTPALPVHDSVIAPAKKEHLLEQVMVEEYEKIMKFKPIVEREN